MKYNTNEYDNIIHIHTNKDAADISNRALSMIADA